MTPLAHALFGLALTLTTWRALAQDWPDQFGDPAVASALRVLIPFAAAAGSALSIAAGRLGGDPARSFRHDALSALGLFVGLLFIALGPAPRDAIGLAVVLILAARLVPAAWWTIRFGAPPLFVFALCLSAYGGLATWRVASSLPLGDQVFYLLGAERLTHGDLEATIDPARFIDLVGIPPQPSDVPSHVVNTPVGPRQIQGYVLSALIAPGWVVAGELGATLVIAVIAAWAATQTWLLLGETVPDRRVGRVTWALFALLAPFTTLAAHIYPNALAAALITTGYRYAFTARHRRSALAGALLGATAFLNPRDGLAVLTLAPFVLAHGRVAFTRFAVAATVVVLVAALSSLAVYGIPLPYAGYLVWLVAPSAGLPPESTFTFYFWVGLPAMLFDRTFGVASFAPWLFIAVVGVASALRADRARLLPAAVTIAAGLAVLSLFRYWEGGYAPPGRYLLDVLPLVAPFVAYGLAAMRSAPLRGVAIALIAVGVVASLLFAAVPTTALNTAFDNKLQDLLDAMFGASPTGWLPSFQPTTRDWYVGAYLRVVPAMAGVAALAWLGGKEAARRYRRAA
jgi:hypothetical protein